MEKVIQLEDSTVIDKKEAEVDFDCNQVPVQSKSCDKVNRNGVIDKRVVKTFNQVLLSKNEAHFSNCSPDARFKAGGKSVVFQSDYVEKNNIGCTVMCEGDSCCSGAVNETVVGAKEISDDESNRKSVDAPKEINDVAIDEVRNYSDNASRLLSTLVIKDNDQDKEITFIQYESEDQLPDLVALITVDLSEPYSVYTYRYFLHNWPHLSHLAYHGSQCVGAIVCKLDIHRKNVYRGYIAMLVVHKSYRRWKIGSSLVKKAVSKMINHGCEEVVLETEVTNKAALKLYENLGFVRDKRLLRYYLNGVDAWRLKLWLK